MPSSRRSIEQSIGDSIRARREELGLSQESLALECGLHRTYISQLERGKKSPTLRVLIVIAQVLKIEPSELVRQAISNSN